MEQDVLTITLKQKIIIMKNRFKEKKIPDDYHTLGRAGQVTLILCLHTDHNRLNSRMNRRENLVPSPTTLFRARTGTLKLNIERRHTDGYTNCEICKANTTEYIEHFLLNYETITSTSQYVTGLQRKERDT